MYDGVLVDTSVWVSWFRRLDRPGVAELEDLLRQRRALLSDPVRMELLMGVPQKGELRFMRQLIRLEMVSVEPRADFDLAAEIHRATRRAGHTIRSSNDLLIAAVAIRTGYALLHDDVDFERISAVIPELRSWPIEG